MEERRLNAIKLRYCIFKKQCCSCKDNVGRERVWTFFRYGENKSIHRCFYCQRCMHSVEDVLLEIDTDKNPFGIAFVDDFMVPKKSCVRLRY